MHLIKSTCSVILVLFSFNSFAFDLSKLEGNWRGVARLGDLDFFAALIIKSDLSGEYIEASFTNRNVAKKRTFTVNDIIERDGYIEITIKSENDIAPQKLIFVKNGNEIKGMHIATIKEDTVLYYTLKLMKSKFPTKTQQGNSNKQL